MAKIADKVFELIEETVNAQGVELWDVRFVKEGVSHYLRVFIDKPGGVDINDCTNVSHAIDPIIDEADPIDVSYYLEVSSPGLNRELTREKHFKAMLTKPITVKLYKAFEGQKQISGKLIDYDDGPTVLLDDGRTVKFTAADISKAILNEDF
ncbi:MAG: ribosome maturation factor RimP [Clostridia bacterium]|nr:ribosome maturation factor RimP [Clostridia bacterium]